MFGGRGSFCPLSGLGTTKKLKLNRVERPFFVEEGGLLGFFSLSLQCEMAPFLHFIFYGPITICLSRKREGYHPNKYRYYFPLH